MDLKQTVDNLGGIDAVEEAEQLAAIWNGSVTTANAGQLAAELAAADAARNKQISQAETEIAAEQKQVQANDQAIDAAVTSAAVADLAVAALGGRQQQLEADAAPLEKEAGTGQ